MNKKLNTLIFVLVASVFNILLMLALFIAGIVGLSLLPMQALPAWISQFSGIVLFVVAIGLSFLIYHKIMKLIIQKVDMDKYFEPFFRKKR